MTLQLLSEHIRVMIFSCSEYEARNYGMFIRTLVPNMANAF